MSIRKAWTLLVCCCFSLALGCSYNTLSFFFDGVPNPQKGKGVVQPGKPGGAEAAAKFTYFEHGPYAAKQCNACHNRELTNNLVAPKDQLCSICHQFPMTRKYIHGPLLSGGCLVCHDPHSSQYRFLLKSSSDSICFYCHDEKAIAKIEAHRDNNLRCTSCHDAHMSDKKFLLK